VYSDTEITGLLQKYNDKRVIFPKKRIFAFVLKSWNNGKQSDALCAPPKHGTTEAFFCNTTDIQWLQNADAASFSAQKQTIKSLQ